MSDLMPELVAVGVYFLWLVGSTVILLRIGFFSAGPLEAASPRPSQFTMMHFFAIGLLYVSTVVLAFAGAMKLGYVPAGGEPATQVATTTTTTTSQIAQTAASPATQSILKESTTAAAEASAVASAPAPSADYLARTQIIDCAVRLGIAGLILWLARMTMPGGVRGFGMSLRQLPRGVAMGIGAAVLLAAWMFAIQVVAGIVSHLFRKGPPPVHPILEVLGNHPALWIQIMLALAAVVIAPLTEEIFFRGLLQTALNHLFIRRPAPRQPQNFGFPVFADAPQVPPQDLLPAPLHDEPPAAIPASRRWLTICIASLLFASVHISVSDANYEVVPILFVLAATLGYLYERTGNLYACITLHALFNAVSTGLTLFN